MLVIRERSLMVSPRMKRTRVTDMLPLKSLTLRLTVVLIISCLRSPFFPAFAGMGWFCEAD
jgi:hypothetical protein